MRSTLVRRAGYVQFNPNPVSGLPLKFYAFQPSGQANTILPIIDTTTAVQTAQPGGGAPTTLFTKPQPTQSSMFAVGNYLYIGNQYFSQKWDGGMPQGVTNWGIANSGIGNTASGYAAAVIDNGNRPVINWTSILAALGPPDNNDASVSFTAPAHSGVTSDSLFLSQYNLNIGPANTVNGVQVTLTAFKSGLGIGGYFTVSLLFNGATIGTSKQIILASSAGNQTFVLGTATDNWGANLTPALVNSSSFGVSITATINNQGPNPITNTFSVDAAQISVNSNGGPTVMPTGAGGFTATQGYQYVFAYGNSNDSAISNPTPPSVSTGPFNNVLDVQVGLVASADPQVNQIRVFRTTDTGTGSVFFELPTSPYPNITQSITDSSPDITLQVARAINSPTFAFSPPPAGLQLMAWYAGRMWGAVGNLLYFSAGPDNAPLGDQAGASAWPPQNVFVLPTTIVKLIPIAGGNGMFVVTLDKIHVVQGIQNPGFTVNVWNPDIGARQQNAVDSDGSNIYIFTSDRQFLQITAQGINELSQYVSDQTDLFDPTQVYVVQHRSGSQDSRVFLSDGSLKILPYNLMSACWEPVQIPIDGGAVGAIDSIEISPGVYKFLKGSTNLNDLVLQRDINTFTDNGTQYGWNVLFGNIPVADPTQLANVDSLVLRMTNAGALPAFVGITPNDTSGFFIQLTTAPTFEPPEASAGPTGHRAVRYYLSTGTNLWQQMMHFQLAFTFAFNTQQEEILSWGIFPNASADQQTGQIPQVQGR